MDEKKLLDEVKAALAAALDSRRGLVAYSRMEAMEMDQRAREVEREALERVRTLVPSSPADQRLQQVRLRLLRMDEALQLLAGRAEIADRSRALERDDITWRTFEDISWLLET